MYYKRSFLILICLNVVLLLLVFSLKSSTQEIQYDNIIIIEENPLTSAPSTVEDVPLKNDIFTMETIEEPVEENTKETYKNTDSLLNPSNVSIAELEAGLKYELVPLAAYFLEAERLYGVNACYLASIAALESGWGRYQFRENNLFGFGRKSFDTPEECIYYVAEFLATEYLSEDGRYFGGGYSLYHVNKYYNGSDEWYESVSSIYASIMRRIEEYRSTK